MAKRFRFQEESRFERTPAEVWPIVSDTARLNEAGGTWQPYSVEEVTQADGSVRRFARGRLGPLKVAWEEGFGEWVENAYVRQVRRFTTGPVRSFGVEFRLAADAAGGTRVVYAFEAEWDSLLGGLLIRSGEFRRASRRLVRTVEAMVAALGRPEAAPAREEAAALSRIQRERLAAAVAAIEEGGFGHGLGARLADFLTRAPLVDLARIRPLALARAWGVPTAAAVGLCVAAQRAGLLAMHWAILCPRCRGAKSQVTNLYELPRGVHCESCNIDFERAFSANVELVFRPAGWLRDLPDGEFCMMGAATTPHVKVQRRLGPGEAIAVPLALAAGAYRLRTVEAGGHCDIDCDGSSFPEVVARADSVEAGPPSPPGQIALRNEAARPLSLVVELRDWIADALTGPKVIAMPAFRELCPEQVLRPGDDVSIGQVTIVFSDLKGSTALYAAIGDSTAYGLVRDHFAFLAERVSGHNGVLVKTIGDAIMAAFDEPTDAVRAALAIRREVGAFNAAHGPAAIVLKLGLHCGECIAVNTGGRLDYFGATVNLAARLQGQSRGGDIVLSAETVAEPAVARVLDGIELRQESATLHGLAEAVGFYRVPAE